MNKFLSAAVRAAKNAGKLILNNLGKISKGDIDIKDDRKLLFPVRKSI